ncbi:MAG: hypothetical protein M1813_006238 [Trichoglossum hirsutum]|nr:MAG: hypothetical protein M1813_006238 [Trichoglossum hirsutum]
MPAVYGNLFLAFLVLFVGWTGSHMWGILCFSMHQLRSTMGSHDGLHYQQQAVFRNSRAPSAVLWRLLRLCWSWRRSTKGPIRRSLLLLLIVVAHLVSFFAAATLSSRVTSPGAADALIKSDLCGWPDDRFISNSSVWTLEKFKITEALHIVGRESYRRASAYARSCYGDDTTSYSSICNSYVTSRIVSKVNKTAPCPFAEGACMAPAISMDSGHIDSDLDLGVTATPIDRIQMRRITTCAPIPAEQKYSVGKITPFKSAEGGAGGAGGIEYIYYYLGRNTFGGTEFTHSVSNSSITFASEPYSLKRFNAFAGSDSESVFVPIPQFNRSDADVSLLFLNRALLYTGQVADPWFTATLQIYEDDWGGKWGSSLATTAVGCVEQYQFCNGDRCTPTSGIYNVNDKLVSAVGYSPAQMATFRLLWRSAWSLQMRYLLLFLGTDVLLANNKLYSSFDRLSPALPPNQWQIEMENIHNITMAMLQRIVVEHALPSNFRVSDSASTDSYVIPENDTESLRLCSHQRIKAIGYSSFSVLGLAVIILVGSFIILVNILLPGIVGWFQRKTGRGLHRRREWIESETLQLQRMLFEMRGIGPWEGNQDAVPVTANFGQKFQLGNSLPMPDKSGHVDEVYDPLTSQALE